MTVTDVRKDTATLTMTITNDFDASLDATWQLWADPRQLERWWGPPTHPATVVEHDLHPGADVTYFMTAPDGEEFHGWWRVVAVDAPNHLEFVDGFGKHADDPAPDLPAMTVRVTLTEGPDGGTRMVVETTFSSIEAMEQVLAMGAEEGFVAALSQIDALLEVTSAG